MNAWKNDTVAPRVYLAGNPLRSEQVADAIAGSFRAAPARTFSCRRIYLDTFDWRLLGKDHSLSLAQQANDRTLSLETESLRLQCRFDSEVGDGLFANQLPAGLLRDTVAPLAGIRRLLPLVHIDGEERTIAILNDDEKTVVRLEIADWRVSRPGVDTATTSLPPLLRILALRGYRAESRLLGRLLRDKLGLRRSRTTPLRLASAAINLERPTTKLPKLSASMPIESAARLRLQLLLKIMLANEAGLKGNLDTEFLHDYRVALRRTRAMLSQLDDVLPRALAERYKLEFKWLGGLTGAVRDLDICLLRFDGYMARFAPQVRRHLEPLGEHLRQRHRDAHKQLVSAFGSARYRQLKRDWANCLAEAFSNHAVRTDAPRPAIAQVSHRISRRHRRVLKSGGAITDTSPGAAVHEVRLKCKKLRYLLELYKHLYPADQMSDLLRVLKRLQNVLGDINDLETQQAALQRYAAELAAKRPESADTLLAIGRVIEQLEARQRAKRHAFTQRFDSFASRANRRRFKSLFKTQ